MRAGLQHREQSQERGEEPISWCRAVPCAVSHATQSDQRFMLKCCG